MIATIVLGAVAVAVVFRHDIWPIPAGQGRVVITCEAAKNSLTSVHDPTTGSLITVVKFDWTGEGSANLPPGDYDIYDGSSVSACGGNFHISVGQTTHVESPFGIGGLSS